MINIRSLRRKCVAIFIRRKLTFIQAIFFAQTGGAAGKFPLGGNNKKPGGWPGEIHQYSTTDVDIEGISPGQCNRRL